MSSSTATGMVFEEDSMSGYRCLWDDTYVENPERFKRVLQRCRELGLVERCLQIRPRKSVEIMFLALSSLMLLLLRIAIFAVVAPAPASIAIFAAAFVPATAAVVSVFCSAVAVIAFLLLL